MDDGTKRDGGSSGEQRTAEKVARGFTMMKNRFAKDSGLSGPAKALGLVLASYAGRDRRAWPGMQTLRAQLKGFGVRTIRRARQELVARGYVERLRSRDRRGRLGDYSWWIRPEMLAEPLPPKAERQARQVGNFTYESKSGTQDLRVEFPHAGFGPPNNNQREGCPLRAFSEQVEPSLTDARGKTLASPSSMKELGRVVPERGGQDSSVQTGDGFVCRRGDELRAFGLEPSQVSTTVGKFLRAVYYEARGDVKATAAKMLDLSQRLGLELSSTACGIFEEVLRQ